MAEFNPGDVVWAKWGKAATWYPARVVSSRELPAELINAAERKKDSTVPVVFLGVSNSTN